MLARLDRADIGRAWNIFNQCCAAIECEPAGTMLFMLINAVVSVHALSTADRATNHRCVSREAAANLSHAIDALRTTGASLDGLLPPNAAEPDAFLATLQPMSANAGPSAIRSVQQIRGSRWSHIGAYVALQVAARAGNPTGAAIASTATGARLTPEGIAKAAKRNDPRGFHARLRVEAENPN